MTLKQIGQGSHILAFTDNYSALGWVYKESFDPLNSESSNTIALWFVWALISKYTSLYSQDIEGTGKIISDSLSRAFHISDQILTKNI